MAYRFFAVATCVAVAACTTAPITPDSIRSKPAYSMTFSVDKPYQDVFASLLDSTRNCFSRKSTQEQLYVAGAKDNGKKTANIIVEHLYGALEHDVHFMIDITRKSDKQTQIVGYTSDKSRQTTVDLIKQWVDNPKAQCA